MITIEIIQATNTNVGYGKGYNFTTASFERLEDAEGMTFSVNYPESFYLIMSNAGDQGNFQILYRRDPWITDVTRFDATPSGSNFTLTGFYKGTEV